MRSINLKLGKVAQIAILLVFLGTIIFFEWAKTQYDPEVFTKGRVSRNLPYIVDHVSPYQNPQNLDVVYQSFENFNGVAQANHLKVFVDPNDQNKSNTVIAIKFYAVLPDGRMMVGIYEKRFGEIQGKYMRLQIVESDLDCSILSYWYASKTALTTQTIAQEVAILAFLVLLEILITRMPKK